MLEARASSVAMIITAGVLWGVIGVFSRALNDAGLDSFQVTEVRCFITAMSILVILLFYNRSMLKIEIRDIWMFIGTGICSFILFNVLYFQTAQIVSLSMTAVLLYTAPCFVLIFSLFIFREKLTKQKILALVLAFTGCILTAGIIGGSEEFSLLGFTMGLGSGVGYAMYTIFSKFALKKYHPFTVTFYTFLVASLALMPFCMPWEIVDVAIHDNESILWMVGLGILITLIPYFLYTAGLKGLDAGVASVLAFTEPMVATIAGFVIYGETMTVFNILGIILILLSIMTLNLDRGRLRVMIRNRKSKENV